MLAELRVSNLGVIADLRLTLGHGMTALTGETGAGKTLLVEAIELLVGGRADGVLVRPGADEATVEGRFVWGDQEVVLARVVPAGGGRSRAYVDGRMAPVAALADTGRGLVDLHGQHAHQSLLSPAVQRAALDGFAGADLAPLGRARARVQEIDGELAALGGDARDRAREVDLLRFQVAEIERARIGGDDEDDRLAAEEARLAGAADIRAAAAAAHEALAGDGAATDALGAAIAAASAQPVLEALAARLRGLQAEVADVAGELRAAAEETEDDPARLAEVQERRQALRELRRKYGDTLADVRAFYDEASARLQDLESHEARAAALEGQRAAALEAVRAEASALAACRRAAAPRLAAAVEERLRALAMPRARVDVAVGGDDPGDEVTILLGANPGEPLLPLAKVASGGELARAMLAARLVLTDAPPTLVFDEVDAGIGGEAGLGVGRALAEVATRHQVLVVTHLPQVAAFADHQVAVAKREVGGRTIAEAKRLDPAGRVVELSRMLSGRSASAATRQTAEELLHEAARERGR